ncbi:MAG TPA: pyruvate, phosphate dikinase [Solirubrobacteraceae bacterium]|jgi:pyruvate,orthophosphate dikinase|nr:pyruvate, phosphate dikinase [Solirubrobacteraceae bacterium]
MGALTYSFHDGGEAGREILGGKGEGLVSMVRLGLPVPPGFIIGTPAGREFAASGALPTGLLDEVHERVAALEAGARRRFGDDRSPLLVSVRSGAPVSMPGMMDTVLNVGLTPAGAEALARETGDERFAQSSLERLLHGFATTVRGISAGVVEDALLDLPAGAGASDRCVALLALIEEQSGVPFPDACGQLAEAIAAVFRSWDSPRAQAYRRHKGIDESMGTAVVVQQMVFGNRGQDSGSGVAFTRDPSTGARGAFGDVLFDAQGEDVVAGERDTLALGELGTHLPAAMAELERVFEILERDTGDLCDIEFTIEQGRVWILQTRVGQRSARAAVRLAVAFAEEGLISRAQAVARVSDEQLIGARAAVFACEPAEADVLARGLAASPGAAVGIVALTSESAQARAEAGEAVILVRPTTSPADLSGVLASAGLVTARGGRASHAAVVARGLNRPAVCGTGELPVHEGETISVDGDRGIVARGAQPRRPAEEDPVLATFLQWHRELGAAPVAPRSRP